MSTDIKPGSVWVAKGGGINDYIVLGTVEDVTVETAETVYVVYKVNGSRSVSAKHNFLATFEPKPKPQIVDVRVFDPWPFKQERIETTLHYIGSRGLRDPDNKFDDQGWQLCKGIDNIIVTFDDGVQAVTTSYYLRDFREQNQ